MRRLIAFPCVGETLVSTLDDAAGTTGLLIVSGGNEIRIGAHRGMALLAAALMAEGVPVFRFDRRGIGDSTGVNQGFRASADDIAAAADAFRAAQPQLQRIVAFGNCDAASALALFHAGVGIDALVLANPWVVAPQADLPPPAAIRARYADRLRDPAQWARLIKGDVSFLKLGKGLSAIAKYSSRIGNDLADDIADALNASKAPLTILLASGDNTAIAFADAWQSPAFAVTRTRAELIHCDTASHSFARVEDKAWLRNQLLRALAR